MDKTDVTLRDGTIVRCQSVNHLAIALIVEKFPGCQIPDAPIEEIPSVAPGVISYAMARPGTPQYLEWQRECDKVRELKARIENEARYYVGISSWKLPGGSRFTRDVPKDWKFPEALLELGAVPREKELESSGMATVGRRWDYILYELLGRDADLNEVSFVVYGVDKDDVLTDDSPEPVTEEEVQAIAEKFPGDAQGTTAS